MKLLISPHDDDNALFAAFTCMREKPLILVVLDSFIQPNRGEKGCSAHARANETLKAAEILGCEVERLSLRDDIVAESAIETELHAYEADVVYAPALQGGNKHHDMVSRAATKVFTDKVIYYTTYSKEALYTTGTTEIIPTPEELDLKNRALECYQSQLKLPATQPHFDAIIGRSEWLL